MNSELDILILAAGLGTRMRSGKAKVLHQLDGRPLIAHVCETAAKLEPANIFVVVGHQADKVEEAVRAEFADKRVAFVRQERQLGTGDAVASARKALAGRNSTLLILSGDVPLISVETLNRFVEQHAASKASATILTVTLDDPTGYGRVVRSQDDAFERIVEQKDASPAELAVDEINSGIYCFETQKLFAALAKVSNENAQGEYYLTDVPGILKNEGETVALFHHTDPLEIEGVNDRRQLAEMERRLRFRTVERLMLESGVTFTDPASVCISSRAAIGRDTVVYQNVTIEGRTTIGENCIIRPGTRISASKLGSNVEIRDNCLIADSTVADNCIVGPMAHLRGHAEMAEDSRVGNFVELKKTHLGKGSKANHLTYLGDATIGEKTNIGAGTITCNYDGKNKNPTTIGDRVKIGSDTMLVAPVKVGDGAVTAAGSVVIEDVPEKSLVAGVPAKVKKSVSK
ncbi:MAG: UDP-N-acetylglucosamine diphosphorylase/glucosamine-1-phosphate N-acetyltransferase [Acidobacteria bacterium ACB1]|nr:UDP-N-acetylglucosamine diphosphorylase/glucosamine-1-phosphate N-acetyltransferase [Acidobacteria bacterium ACB1]RIJ89185.1 MAG: UDP-N-acetylglucosamine diphosphorylase/glucosamine-1-phosphate N-acetyltransferase [Acidobacteriota bacterium]